MTVVRHGYPQLWVRPPPPSDDEHPPNSDYEDESSELSELDSDNPSEEESTPDTEEYDSEETKFDEDHDFHRRDSVWVKPKGTLTWYQGVITKIKQPTDLEPLHVMKPGPLYLVVFRRYHTNLRAWFSPLEGSMKPDTPHVRALLQGSS